jgi:glutamyl-tRNA reductase
MHLIEIGLDHRTADVTVRERLAMPADALPQTFERLLQIGGEAAVISTCNRVEVYLQVDRLDVARRQVVGLLAEQSGLSVEQLGATLTLRHDDDAVRHLFRVASGLESMIVGEPEIAGQVRTALKRADEQGTLGPSLRRLFSDALSIAGKVRQESGVSREPVSVSTTAVRLAERSLGGLADRTALVIGAGAVGRAVARTLVDLGTGRMLVASRRLESAQALASLVGGEALGLDSLADALARADLVISATGAPNIVVSADLAQQALQQRPDRALLLVDIAVPRDIDPAIRDLPGCSLFDVDNLAAARESSLSSRRLQAEQARDAIEGAVERYVRWWHGLRVAPVVAELTAHVERVRLAETERALARHGETTERERQLVEAATAALVKKLLHRPIVELKRRGAADDAEAYVATLRDLFALPSPDETSPTIAMSC